MSVNQMLKSKHEILTRDILQLHQSELQGAFLLLGLSEGGLQTADSLLNTAGLLALLAGSQLAQLLLEDLLLHSLIHASVACIRAECGSFDVK